MAKFKTAATIIRVFIMNRIRSSYLNNLFSRLQIFTTWLMSFAMFKPDMLFMDRVTPRDSKGSLVLRGMIGVNIAIECVIVDAQEMFALRMPALSPFMRCD